MYVLCINVSLLALQVAQKVFGGEVKKHVLLFESSKADTAKANQDNLREVAKEFKGKVCSPNMFCTSSYVRSKFYSITDSQFTISKLYIIHVQYSYFVLYSQTQ